MITNRLHRERLSAAPVTEHLTGGETALRLVSTDFDRDLTTYAVRPSYDADDGLSVQLLAPLAEAGARSSLPSSLASQTKNMSARSLVQDSATPAMLARRIQLLSGDGHRHRGERPCQHR